MNLSFLLFFSFVFLIFDCFASNTPWAKPREQTAPWISRDRKVGREAFFKNLSDEKATADADSAANPADETIAEDPGVTEDEQDDVDKEETLRKIRDEVQKAETADKNSKTPVQSPIALAPVETATDLGLSELPWDNFRTKFPNEKFAKKLLWPVEGGRLSSGFGVRGGRFHEGLDLTAPEGSSVRATSAGRVVFNGKLKGYGNTVVIYHGSGITSIYAHNSKNLKMVGERVAQGSAVAEVGNTGRSKGMHCHFEIRRDGRPINPLLYSYLQSPLVASRGVVKDF